MESEDVHEKGLWGERLSHLGPQLWGYCRRPCWMQLCGPQPENRAGQTSIGCLACSLGWAKGQSFWPMFEHVHPESI